MKDIIDNGPFRGSREERKKQLWSMIQDEYERQDSPHRLHGLTLGMIEVKNNFPSLSTKAAETNSLIPVMAEVCARVHDGSEQNEHRRRAVEYMREFYKLLRSAGNFLTAAQADEAVRLIDWHGLHYNW